MHHRSGHVTPEKWGPDPDTPGVPQPPDERYVAIDLELLEALRKLDRLHRSVNLVLRVAQVAKVEGRIVFGVRFRDLDDDS